MTTMTSPQGKLSERSAEWLTDSVTGVTQHKFGCLLYFSSSFTCLFFHRLSQSSWDKLNPERVQVCVYRVYEQYGRAGSPGCAGVSVRRCCSDWGFCLCVCVCVEVSGVSFLSRCVWWGSCRQRECDGVNNLFPYSALLALFQQSYLYCISASLSTYRGRDWHKHSDWEVTSMNTAFCWAEQRYTCLA